MKLLHLSDLHLGKRINEFSMIDDQEYILMQILKIVGEEKPDAVLIAGDIYDKSIPSAEAVILFDKFLTRLSIHNAKVFIISGNHDSPERIAFGANLLNSSGVFLSPVYSGEIKPVSMTDGYGVVDLYLLPFVKPATVRHFFPEEEIESYTDAVRIAVGHMPRDSMHRSVLITHQFFAGATTCDSEEISVGGTDVVDTTVLAGFDYVALGHLHGPQNVGANTIRYCGSPLMYSFSEVSHRKSLTVVELFEKGNIKIDTRELVPLHKLREIRGSYMDVTARTFYDGTKTDDYLHVTLTDEQDIPDALGKLRAIYPNIMKLDYDNARTRSQSVINDLENLERKSPLALFSDFYEMQNNLPLCTEQHALLSKLIENIWEETL